MLSMMQLLNRSKSRTILLALMALSITGCDKFHSMYIQLPETVMHGQKVLNGSTSKEAAISTLREFSKEIGFGCLEQEHRLYKSLILTCGPYGGGAGPLHLYYQDQEFFISFRERAPLLHDAAPSPYFCYLKEKMFKFYSDKFGKENVKLDVIGDCSLRKPD